MPEVSTINFAPPLLEIDASRAKKLSGAPGGKLPLAIMIDGKGFSDDTA
jgi:hypothetical protein